MDYMSFAYHKRKKVIGIIGNSFPLEEYFNSEATHYEFKTDSTEWTKTSTKYLVQLKSNTLVQFYDPTHAKHGATAFLGSFTMVSRDLNKFKVLPDDYEFEPIKRGDVVQNSETMQVGIVAGITIPADGSQGNTVYKVIHYNSRESFEIQLAGDERLQRKTLNPESFYHKTWGRVNITKIADIPPFKIGLPQSVVNEYKERFRKQVNSQNSQYSTRGRTFYKKNAETWETTRTKLNEQGRLFAKFLSASKKGVVIDLGGCWQNVIKNILNSSFISLRRNIHLSDYEDFWRDNELFRICPECGAWEVWDDVSYSEWHGTSFCRNCEHRFVYSEYQGDYIREEEIVRYYTSVRQYNRGENYDFVAREYARGRSNFLFYDGEAFSEDAYFDLQDQIEEENRPSSGLYSYHSSPKAFHPIWEDKRYLPLGLEIETYNEDRYDATRSLYDKFNGLIYMEEDGSLNYDYGFEVITQPLGKKEWAAQGMEVLAHMRKLGCVSYNSPAGKGYGIHINIGRQNLSPLQEARMYMFLTADSNYHFVLAIAQRDSVYAADTDICSVEEINIDNLGGLRSTVNSRGKRIKKMMGQGKYCPINFKDDRLEVRIFQSTLNGTSFNKNLEFIWALLEWTNVATASGVSYLATDFVKWLAKRPAVETDYPNLVAYLRRPSYKTIDGSDIKNTWADLIPKETRKSIPQNVVNLFTKEDYTADDHKLIAA